MAFLLYDYDCRNRQWNKSELIEDGLPAHACIGQIFTLVVQILFDKTSNGNTFDFSGTELETIETVPTTLLTFRS